MSEQDIKDQWEKNIDTYFDIKALIKKQPSYGLRQELKFLIREQKKLDERLNDRRLTRLKNKQEKVW